MYDNAKLESAVRPSTEIESCMDRANNSLERLHGRISVIEDRLRPVMRVTGTGQLGSVAAVPKETLSPLGDSIRNFEDRTDSAVDRLEALLNGIAL